VAWSNDFRLTAGWSDSAVNKVPVAAPWRVAQPERYATREMSRRWLLGFGVALIFAAHPLCLAGDSLPKCGDDVKPEKFVSFDEYSPHPCSFNAFSVEVEFTVNALGRASDIRILRPKVLPPDKRQCISGAVDNWLKEAGRFSRPRNPCLHRLRVTTTVQK
jgi:hypothetical protein